MNKETLIFFVSEYPVVMDREDAEILTKIKSYSVRIDGHNKYVSCRIDDNGRMKYTSLHRIIMEKYHVIGNLVVDHKSRNCLDNRKSNLRLATKQQNSMNSRKQALTHSKYKGVTWHKPTNKWQAKFAKKYLGIFDTEELAAKAYFDYASKTAAPFVSNEILEDTP